MNVKRIKKTLSEPADMPGSGSPNFGRGKTDWHALSEMSDEEVDQRALGDPDNPPSTPEQLRRMKRISFAKRVRLNLGLSQVEFADRYGIPVGTLRDWEQHRSEPDQAALSYLKAINAEPEIVAKALESA